MNLFLIIATIGTFTLVLTLTIMKYKAEIKGLRLSFQRLSQTFDDLDEQAKIIVKTDLELHKTQEELDKRLSALDALQKLSREINTPLDENEIFSNLSFELLNNIGFEKYMFLLFTKNDDLQIKRLFGFTEQEEKNLKNFFHIQIDLFNKLKKGGIVSSFNITVEHKRQLDKILETSDFVIAPILAQSKLLGLTVAGNHSPLYASAEGDSEIISILADQVGQAIENARLFEAVYRASHELEQKIQERTHQLTKALEHVKKVSKTKSEFISAVSHELRTPLTSIKGYASLLMAGKIGNVPDSVKERLAKINKHSDNLVALINNLLDISRIESGKANMKFKFQPLSSIIETIEDLLMPQLKEKKLSFQKNIPDDLPNIFVDASQLERVFINLVGNAIKFTPENGVITISATAKKYSIEVSIADTGIGLQKEDADKLFDEFYRVENEINETVKGTGLGLSLVKKIIEAHEGQIFVKSKIGEGTAFYFTLPTRDISSKTPVNDNNEVQH